MENKKDEHIIHLWEPFSFKTKKGFDYRRNTPLKRLNYFVTRGLVQGILDIYNQLFFGMKIEGQENLKKIPKKQGAVIISNHVHIFDCTIIASIVGRRRRIYFTTLESNFNIPIIRHLVKGLGGVPIPNTIQNLNEFFKQMEESLKRGDFVVMYPESVLYPYYEGLRDFKSGAFHLAVDSKAPIIPMVFTFRKPKGIYILKKKPCIKITALQPVYANTNLPRHKQIEDLMTRSHESMNETIENKISSIPSSRRYCFGLRVRNHDSKKSKK